MSDRRGRALIAATVCTAAVALTGALGSSAGQAAAGAARALRLAPIGNFNAPVYVDNAPGAPKLLFVVEQPGTIRVVRGGKDAQAAVPRHPQPGAVRRASRGCCRSPSTPTTRSNRRFYVYYVNNGGNIEVDGFRRKRSERHARRGALAPQGDRDPAPHLREPQRRPAAVRPRRAALHGHRRRRLGRRSGRQRPEPRRAARQAAAHRPEAQARLLDPALEPVQGPQAGATRSTRSGCATRSASRFDSRSHDICDRRRRPGRVGGDRSRRRGGGSPAPTSAGTSSRARTRTRAAARPPSYVPPGARVLARRRAQLRRHRRLRDPRPQPAGASTAATSTATSAAGRSARSTPTAPGRATRRLGSTSTS